MCQARELLCLAGRRGGAAAVRIARRSLDCRAVHTACRTLASNASLLRAACRYGNPTTRACEEKIRELEGAEDCLVSSSGMNAATTMLLALVPAGGHIVTTTDCYRRTRQFIQTVLPKVGVGRARGGERSWQSVSCCSRLAVGCCRR